MASNSQGSLLGLYPQDGYAPNAANNSFVSMWCDKRSATHVSLSLTFYGSGTPDGYAQLQVSNAPENSNTTYGGGPLVLAGQTDPPDVIVIPNSAITITATGAANGAHWEVDPSAHRWIRVQYVSTVSSANLQAYCFVSVPFESP